MKIKEISVHILFGIKFITIIHACHEFGELTRLYPHFRDFVKTYLMDFLRKLDYIR